jgi:hypothetical protein
MVDAMMVLRGGELEMIDAPDEVYRRLKRAAAARVRKEKQAS